jgi:predicted Zn-dependent protease
MSRARQQLPATAERVQDTATKTAWITFAAMLISLLAAVAGAMAGRQRAARRLVGESRDTATIVR